MTIEETTKQQSPVLTVEHYRADMNHYWGRLCWYRDELWRVTTPIFTAYGAFVLALVGYLFTKDIASQTAPMIINMIILLATVTYILLKLYFIYSSCIYKAVKYLNHEIETREKWIYNEFHYFTDFSGNKVNIEPDYKKFKVFPELNILFGIIVLLMSGIIGLILLSMLQKLGSYNLDTSNLFVICISGGAVSLFELLIKSYAVLSDEENNKPQGKNNV